MEAIMRSIILATVAALTAPGALAQNVYVTAERLLDITTGQVIQTPAIVIQSGVITAVGLRGAVQVPSAAQVIELPGATLLCAKLGALNSGVAGDLVGVIGDPTQNVTLLESPVFVMKGGDVIKAPAD
jgi:imidazolonepropionase-like amidohydrolase